MKKSILLLLTLFCIQLLDASPRKKVAVVLSGGGAKGAAHIGVLKVLEEAGIPIDYIVGTSMGSIVGGLYATGYSTAKLDSMLVQQDWRFLLSDDVQRNNQSFPVKENSEKYILSLPFGKEKKDRLIPGVIKGRNLYNLFSDLTIGYHDSVDFNTFRIPFACVAVNIVNGKEYVFHNGSLPLAMRASMAMPAVFSPVKLDSMLLVDGGLNNNYPVDVARQMGADIIIGVDLQPGELKTAESLNNAADMIGQIVTLHSFEKYQKNLDDTQLLIRPDMTSYNSASFSTVALDSLIRRGEKAARAKWDDIIRLKEEIGLSENNDILPCLATDPYHFSDTFFIHRIIFRGINPRDEKWLARIIQLKENSWITLQELQKAMSTLAGTNAYSDISYKLTGKNAYDLVLSVEPKSISSLNLGLRFDSEEIINVLVNATLDYQARYKTRLSFSGKIGQNSYARLDYTIGKNPLRNFNVAYLFSDNDIDFFQKGEKIFNSSFQRHMIQLGYTDINWLNFKFQTGMRYEYFDFNPFLHTGEEYRIRMTAGRFTSAFALIHLETMDKKYFPTQGVSMKAEYAIYINDFIANRARASFSALNAQFTAVLPLNSHLSLLPSLYGRSLIGNNPAYPFMNVLGGDSFGRYLPQQMPFAGINHPQIFDNTVVVSKLHLRQRIAQKHYISLIGNCAIHHNDFFQLLKGKYVWGGSIGYAYNSIAGPLCATMGISDQHKRPQFYINLGYSF